MASQVSMLTLRDKFSTGKVNPLNDGNTVKSVYSPAKARIYQTQFIKSAVTDIVNPSAQFGSAVNVASSFIYQDTTDFSPENVAVQSAASAVNVAILA